MKALYIVGILILGLIVTIVFYPKYQENKRIDNLTLEVLKKVRDRMKDPYSVKFDDLMYRYVNNNKNREIHVCGIYNAKNSMGGYVGYKLFSGHAKESERSDLTVSILFEDDVESKNYFCVKGSFIIGDYKPYNGPTN